MFSQASVRSLSSVCVSVARGCSPSVGVCLQRHQCAACETMCARRWTYRRSVSLYVCTMHLRMICKSVSPLTSVCGLQVFVCLHMHLCVVCKSVCVCTWICKSMCVVFFAVICVLSGYICTGICVQSVSLCVLAWPFDYSLSVWILCVYSDIYVQCVSLCVFAQLSL